MASDVGRESTNAFREKVDEGTAAYFLDVEKNLSSLLQRPDAYEEMEALVQNALEETSGKQLQASCDHRCSRPLEKLLEVAHTKQLLDFLKGFSNSDKIVTLFINPFGSHVAEALLRGLAERLDDMNEDEWIQTKKMVSDVARRIEEDVLNISMGKYGSHVLRTWTKLLSGQLQSNESRRVGKDGKRGVTWNGNKRLQGPFQDLFLKWSKNVLDAIREDVSTLLRHPSSSPFLQALLESCQGDEDLHRYALEVMTMRSSSEGRSGERRMEEVEWTKLMKEKTSSHAVEAILASMTEDLRHEFYTHVLRGKLMKLCLHPAANYPVQTFLSTTLSKPHVGMVLDEIGPHVGTLLQRQRSGVVAALVAACGRLRHERKAMCKCLARGVLEMVSSDEDRTKKKKMEHKQLIPLLLKVDRSENRASGKSKFGKRKRKQMEDGPGNTKRQEDEFSPLGCQMASILLRFPLECSQQFVDSMVSLDEEELIAIACSSCGSHVVESFFESMASGSAKKKMASVLGGHIESLCYKAGPSFVLQKAFSHADASTREHYAKTMANLRTELCRCRHGPHLLRACGAEEYAADPVAWSNKQKSSAKQLKSFTQEFGKKELPL